MEVVIAFPRRKMVDFIVDLIKTENDKPDGKTDKSERASAKPQIPKFTAKPKDGKTDSKEEKKSEGSQ